MRSPASEIMVSNISTSSRTPVSWSMISTVDWRNDGLCSICLAARSPPSVGLCFVAGVIGNNTDSVGVVKQGCGHFACLLVGAAAVYAVYVEVARVGALLFVVDRNAIHGFALRV